jgi:thiamine pyrophosphate-dependent acetolactate synthase large subunit-like protein
VLLVVGSRLGQFTSHFDHRSIRAETRIVQVDVDTRDIGRYYPVAVGIQADARLACEALLAALSAGGAPASPPAWRQEAEALRAQRQARLAAEGALDAKPMKPQRVYAELRRALPPETMVTLDAGAAPAYGYDRLHLTRPGTLFTPLDLGGLGFAFPVALGAKLGRPEAPALAIHGDGGFLMNAQELETAVRHRINAVTLVMNNNCWGSEKAYQQQFYGGPATTSSPGSSGPTATTSIIPTRSATPSAPHSAPPSRPSSRSPSTPTSCRHPRRPRDAADVLGAPGPPKPRRSSRPGGAATLLGSRRGSRLRAPQPRRWRR